MDLRIEPSRLHGSVSVIPSKSQAHRALICAAFADGPTELFCAQVNRDMEATAQCLRALGAEIQKTDRGYSIVPVTQVPRKAELFCQDSGSTLRFLLPVVGALGVDGTFHMEGRLPTRPLSPLWEELERMGCILTRPTEDTLRCTGQLRAGEYRIRGDVSSQFISGLLFAGALIPGPVTVTLLGEVQSRPYITMTQETMALFGKDACSFSLTGGLPYRSPGQLSIEGDWSSGAFFLGANALGSTIHIQNLNEHSCQGDRTAKDLIAALSAFQEISVADIPDLVPILAVVAACNQGVLFTKAARLRLKESDRVESTLSLIRSLGGKAESGEDTLRIYGTGLTGGTVDAVGDHRIAMAAAIAATACTGPVTILGAQCTDKSYPRFFEEYKHLGGQYEQYIR